MSKMFERTKSERNAVGLRAFFRIAHDWKLSNEQQIRILGVPDTTFYRWEEKFDELVNPSITKNTLERISYVLGIYKNLNKLLTDRESSDSWVHKPNSASLFGGKSAIERMTAGNVADLYVVRRYLDEQLTDGFSK